MPDAGRAEVRIQTTTTWEGSVKFSMVTMSDIAKQARVSLTTVSFVLNGGATANQIGAATRLRVLAVASEMGYRRNGLAHAVAAGKNPVFGYLTVELSEQDSLLLDGILRESASAGYHVKLLGRGEDEHGFEVARHCVEQRLAGLIIRRHSAAVAVCEELESYHIPVVFVDDNRDRPGVGCVGSDDRQGYRLAVEHLIGLGHRSIAYLAGDFSLPQEILRGESFHNVMSAHGLLVPKSWAAGCGWSYERLDTLTRALFQGALDYPTALLCDGDPLAAVAIRTLSTMGLRVPHDVSVVGYGDFSLAELLNPPLTTVAQPFQDMGRAAVRQLLHAVEGDPGSGSDGPYKTEMLTTCLVRRASTAPARSGI